jgi:hypothetical protein
VGEFKITYKMFNNKKIRGSLLALGLPCLSFPLLHDCLFFNSFTYLPHCTPLITSFEPARDTTEIATTKFMTLATSGIEPGPPAWESSTLPNEPLDARKKKSLFSTHIVNIRAHCMLPFQLFSFIDVITSSVSIEYGVYGCES